MLLKDLKSVYLGSLKELYSRQEAGNLFALAAEEVMGLTRHDIHSNHNKDIPQEAEKKMSTIAGRLAKGEPLQYILGYAHFYDLKIAVDRRVLIPRPETEYMVHLVLRNLRKHTPGKIIDLCTGSGCIAIALGTHLPDTEITATDISGRALELAGKNAQTAGCSICFLKDDLLKPENTYINYDCIVSNPPYVRHSEKEWMHRNVLDYEPHKALFVEDKNPLLFYRAIADFGAEHLTPDGVIWCEINENLGTETAALFERRGYHDIRIYKDLNRKDRILKAKPATR